MIEDQVMKERMRHDFILDQTDLLVRYGIPINDALKTSKEFYEKHKDKIKDSFGMF